MGFGKERQLHFRYHRKASVLVYHPHQRVDASSLVNLIAFGIRIAKREEALAHALRLLHNPEILVLEVLGFEYGEFPPTVFGKIDVEAFVIERYFVHTLGGFVGDGNAHLDGALLQRINHIARFHFLDMQFHSGKLLPVMTDEAWKDEGCDGGADRHVEPSANLPFFVVHQFADACCCIEHPLCLTDNHLAHRRGNDRLVRAVEDAHIQLFLQFHEHGAQCGLRNAAGIGGFCEVPITINGNDIA